MPVYVIFEPATSRGIYQILPGCEAKVKGVPGAKFEIALSELQVTFVHQKRHQADRLGLDPLLQANRKADSLATAIVTVR